MKPDVSNAARRLGRLGGSKGGRNGSLMLSPSERTERARAAVSVRWERWRQAHPNGPKVRPNGAEQKLLEALLDDDEVRVEVRDRPKAPGRRAYNAAKKLAARGVVRIIREGSEDGKLFVVIAAPAGES